MSRPSAPFARYVALGDSSTEGLEDPDGRGGYRGWSQRLAERLAATQGEILYANLGVRGRHTREILEQQLPAALAMQPDLVTLFCGTNDLVGRGFSAARTGAEVERMQSALVGQGATVLTFTLPDLTGVMPLGGLLRRRLAALNDALRRAAAASGALMVDFAAHPVASDPRLWSPDRLHANSAGHQRIAAALAEALALPGSDRAWSEPLPGPPPARGPQRLRDDAAWAGRYLLPWVGQHLRGVSDGAGRGPKRPRLAPLTAADCPP